MGAQDKYCSGIAGVVHVADLDSRELIVVKCKEGRSDLSILVDLHHGPFFIDACCHKRLVRPIVRDAVWHKAERYDLALHHLLAIKFDDGYLGQDTVDDSCPSGANPRYGHRNLAFLV